MQRHWDDIYASKAVNETGWYEDVPTTSLALIEHCDLSPSDAILDVGAGAGALVDHLLDRGFTDLTVLDVSDQALRRLRTRLGPRGAAAVRFVRGDITDPLVIDELPKIRLWHDRALLHFLTEETDRDRYVSAVRATVGPGDYVLIATYALDGAPT